MKETRKKTDLRSSGKLILSDIRKNWTAIVTFAIVVFLLNRLFDRVCPSVFITGLPCAGCGMTRSLLALMRLDPVSAAHYNPSIFLWIPVAVVFIWKRYIKQEDTHVIQWWILAVAIGMLIIYIWRMIRFFPSDPPMTYDPDNLLARLIPGYDPFIRSRLMGM